MTERIPTLVSYWKDIAGTMKLDTEIENLSRWDDRLIQNLFRDTAKYLDQMTFEYLALDPDFDPTDSEYYLGLEVLVDEAKRRDIILTDGISQDDMTEEEIFIHKAYGYMNTKWMRQLLSDG